MTKLVLDDIAALQNFPSSTTAINNNSGRIEAAIENTLSRDGTSPNQMESVLDMNSNRIINLPEAIYEGDPVRLEDLNEILAGFDPNIPSGGYVRRNGDTMLGPLTLSGDAVEDLQAVPKQQLDQAVTFIQPSSDAVARLMLEKLRDTVSVRDFGAIGDGTYHPLSERFATLALAQSAYPGVVLGSLDEAIDGVALNAAIQFLGGRGGGVVTVPDMHLVVHLPDSMISNSSSTLRNGAVVHNQSGVVIRGSGRRSSKISAYSDAGTYSLIQMVKVPLENGIVKIVGAGIKEIELDGNYSTFGITDEEETSVGIIAAGLKNCVFDDLYIHNFRAYGIGLQNGGYINNSLNNILIEEVGKDGIDHKDNGSISFGNRISSVTVRRWGLNVNDTAPAAGVDILGVGWHLRDINVTEFGMTGSPGAGIRFKQGASTDDRGNAAERSTLTDFYVEQTAWDVTLTTIGVHVKASKVRVSQGLVLEVTQAGVYTEQPESLVLGCVLKAHSTSAGYGILASARSSSVSEYLNSDRCSFIGNTIIGFNNAFGSVSPDVMFALNTVKDCLIPFEITSSTGTANSILFNKFSNTSGTPTINTNSAHQIFGNTGIDSLNYANIVTPAGTSMRFLGPGSMSFFNLGAEQVRIDGAAGAVNQLRLRGSSSGAAVRVLAEGSDTNVNIRFTPKGSGVAVLDNVPTYADNAAAVTGGVPAGGVYKDSSGMLRIRT